ncbi:MAG: hypothetical protein HY820_09610 [Acidobacteria bacterium]|nr:hypothetical protein [Acidobacteriota bacterium]
MGKLILSTFVLGTSLFAGDMTGWISDATCGASNGNGSKSSRDCAASCIKGGSSAVFVSEKDQKVYKLSDSAKAAKFLDKKVKVSGNIKGDTIEMTNIVYMD